VIFRLRPRLEVMEDRTLLSTFVVSNTGDSGPGSLRQAILDANAQKGAALIPLTRALSRRHRQSL
jgi:hypothetical protein